MRSLKTRCTRSTNQFDYVTTVFDIKIQTNLTVILFSYAIAFNPGFTQQCPNKCSCSPYTKGLVVSCGPGLTGFPANVPATSQIFSIGVGSSNSVNNIATLSQSNFASFSNVVIIHLEFSNVQSIVPGTFSNLPKLVKLNLKANKIRSLSRLVFTGLSRLEHLVLTDNAGCHLDDDVFTDLTSLKSLELGGLHLKTLGNILNTLVSLERLDIHGNRLVRLEYSSFDNLKALNFLDVSFNDLYGIQNGMVNILSRLKYFQLDNNPWRCNCAIAWLKSLPPKFVVPVRGGGSGLVCDQPPNLSFKDLISVPDKDMTCIPARIISCNFYQVTVVEGQTIDVKCQIEGDPYPDVTWSQPDGANISVILMTKIKDIISFSIPTSVFMKHDGQWSVFAENYNGSDVKTIDITIATTTKMSTTATSTKTTVATSHSTINTTPTQIKSISSLFPQQYSTHGNNRGTIISTLTPNPTGTLAYSNLSPSSSTPSSSSSSMDTIYVIIIVAASLSCIVFVTGTCLFIVIVHKAKRKVRIAAKRRSVYSKQEDDFGMSQTPVPPTPLQEIMNFNE